MKQFLSGFSVGVLLVLLAYFVPAKASSPFTERITDGVRTVVCDRMLHAPIGVIIDAPTAGQYSVDVTSVCSYPS